MINTQTTFSKIVQSAEQDFESCISVQSLEETKSRFLGKNSVLVDAFKNLIQLPPNERSAYGKTINLAKQEIETLYQQKKNVLLETEQLAQLNQEEIDVTLPGRTRHTGSIHPITVTQQRLEDIFFSMGFTTADGPEIETDFYNFTALNIPENHPARAMHDTFYLQNKKLLRTHTSPVQIHYLQEAILKRQAPPYKIISSGKVYRVDSDATHSPMFHQIEGLWIDKHINFSHLKGIVDIFLKRFFENQNLEIRFRPSFFPFTEPSAEIDMRWGEHWLEIGGCGMVHPEVFRHTQLDNRDLKGFAFGFGIERLTMIRYNLTDLRQFFSHDLRFLKQFS